jgi:hypothetical protein
MKVLQRSCNISKAAKYTCTSLQTGTLQDQGYMLSSMHSDVTYIMPPGSTGQWQVTDKLAPVAMPTCRRSRGASVR